jgi:hypothetical protein
MAFGKMLLKDIPKLLERGSNGIQVRPLRYMLLSVSQESSPHHPMALLGLLGHQGLELLLSVT